MSWLFLMLGIMTEVCGTTSMKLADGFKHLGPSVMIFVFYGLSFAAFTLSLRTISLTTAYAVWSGLGTALTCLVGFGYFKEPITMLKLASIGLIVIGVIGLRLGEAA